MNMKNRAEPVCQRMVTELEYYHKIKMVNISQKASPLMLNTNSPTAQSNVIMVFYQVTEGRNTKVQLN